MAADVTSDCMRAVIAVQLEYGGAKDPLPRAVSDCSGLYSRRTIVRIGREALIESRHV